MISIEYKSMHLTTVTCGAVCGRISARTCECCCQYSPRRSMWTPLVRDCTWCERPSGKPDSAQRRWHVSGWICVGRFAKRPALCKCPNDCTTRLRTGSPMGRLGFPHGYVMCRPLAHCSRCRKEAREQSVGGQRVDAQETRGAGREGVAVNRTVRIRRKLSSQKGHSKMLPVSKTLRMFMTGAQKSGTVQRRRRETDVHPSFNAVTVQTHTST